MPRRPHQVTFSFEYGSQPFAQVVERSLRQEVGEIDDDRSTTRLGHDGSRLRLTVEAADLVALRAAANTWLSLVEVAERVAETIDF